MSVEMTWIGNESVWQWGLLVGKLPRTSHSPDKPTSATRRYGEWFDFLVRTKRSNESDSAAP